jgi:hypothetical protein
VQTTRVLQLPAWNLSQTNINQSEKYFKKARIRIVYGHGFSCSQIKSSWSCHVKKRKLEATNLLNEEKRLDKQGMLKEQITMMKGQKNITSKGK